MELQQLKYFMVAAKYLHITRAAESLHIAQPALTQSIKRLEDELGVNLFIRSGRNILLSDSGNLLFKRIKPILDELDALPDEIREASGIFRRTIHLNILSASVTLTKLIIKYKELHPEIEFQLSRSENSKGHHIEITTRPYDENLSGTNTAYISEDIMLAVPSQSKFAGTAGISLKDISKESFISLSGFLPLREICDGFCAQMGFLPHITFECDSPDALRELISANMGIAFWPSFSWGIPDKEKIALIPIQKPSNFKRNIIITLNRHFENSKTIRDFYEYIIKEMELLAK